MCLTFRKRRAFEVPVLCVPVWGCRSGTGGQTACDVLQEACLPWTHCLNFVGLCACLCTHVYHAHVPQHSCAKVRDQRAPCGIQFFLSFGFTAQTQVVQLGRTHLYPCPTIFWWGWNFCNLYFFNLLYRGFLYLYLPPNSTTLDWRERRLEGTGDIGLFRLNSLGKPNLCSQCISNFSPNYSNITNSSRTNLQQPSSSSFSQCSGIYTLSQSSELNCLQIAKIMPLSDCPGGNPS